jgi:hypothetical protein
MVDVPVYKRAQVIMSGARAVAVTERRQPEALRRIPPRLTDDRRC